MEEQEEEETLPHTPDWKQQALADFSAWLEEIPDDMPPAEKATVENCDLYTLLSEFSALRQEIKFQNREQNRAVDSLAGMREGYERSLALFEKSVRDIETLAADIRQETEKRSVMPFLDLRDGLVRGNAACKAVIGRSRWYRPAPKGMQSIAEGYEMAIRRFDRALLQSNITPIEATGRPFDPKQMRAVGKGNDPEVALNIVLTEETGGFVRNGEVIRISEVIVNDPNQNK